MRSLIHFVARSRSISDHHLPLAKWESFFFQEFVGPTYGPKFHMVENRLSFSYRNQPSLWAISCRKGVLPPTWCKTLFWHEIKRQIILAKNKEQLSVSALTEALWCLKLGQCSQSVESDPIGSIDHESSSLLCFCPNIYTLLFRTRLKKIFVQSHCVTDFGDQLCQ